MCSDKQQTWFAIPKYKTQTQLQRTFVWQKCIPFVASLFWGEQGKGEDRQQIQEKEDQEGFQGFLS